MLACSEGIASSFSQNFTCMWRKRDPIHKYLTAQLVGRLGEVAFLAKNAC